MRAVVPAAFAALALALAGCSSSPVVTFREGMVVPPPGAEAVDPRCFEAFPELPATEVMTESDLLVRPGDWPAAPDMAVLCWSIPDGPRETAYYATDDGVTADDVFTFYESVLDERSIHDRIEADTGVILTGIFTPQHSFFIEHVPARAYSITWALDGDYAD